MRKRYSRSYTVLSFLTMFSYRELPFPAPFLYALFAVPVSSAISAMRPVTFTLP